MFSVFRKILKLSIANSRFLVHIILPGTKNIFKNFQLGLMLTQSVQGESNFKFLGMSNPFFT
jgi:hypothetical protein